MKIEHLDNSFTKMGTEITEQLALCSEFSIATAFISEDGIDILENCLNKNKKLQSGKLLIGVYGYFNLKANLQRLGKLAQKYSDRVQIRISKDKSFHWKYFQFQKASYETAFIGSANFTGGGLGSNGELVVKLSGRKSKVSTPISKLNSSFMKQWANSGSLANFRIDLYPEIQRIARTGKLPAEFEEFFKNDKQEISANFHDNANLAVVYITRYFKTSTTKQLINYYDNWGKQDIEFFDCETRSQYESILNNKKLLILFRESINKYTASWGFVVGSSDSIKTAEGKFFIAYKISRKEKKISLHQKQRLLIDFNINLKARKDPFIQKIYRRKQAKELETLLK
jgi:HKD family nuclease